MLLKHGWWEPAPAWDLGDRRDLLEHLIVPCLCRDSAETAPFPQLHSILWLEMTQSVQRLLSPALLNPFPSHQLCPALVPITQPRRSSWGRSGRQQAQLTGVIVGVFAGGAGFLILSRDVRAVTLPRGRWKTISCSE